MATNKQINISKAVVHINGVALFGGVKEVTIEGVKAKMAEFVALGMSGTVEYAVGMEKMGLSMKLTSINDATAGNFGDIYTSKAVQVRCNHVTNGSSGRLSEVPLVYKLTATSKTAMAGLEMKPQEMAEFEVEMSVSEITVELDNVEIFHFSALTDAHRVNGVTVNQVANNNVGI